MSGKKPFCNSTDSVYRHTAQFLCSVKLLTVYLLENTKRKEICQYCHLVIKQNCAMRIKLYVHDKDYI